MSKEIAEQKIKDAGSVLALAKSLHRQLKDIENAKFDDLRNFFDFLVLLQTSIYSTLVLNLYHLLKDGEKHSIAKLINLSVEYFGLDQKLADQLRGQLAAAEKPIEELKLNRDKRIAHFDKANVAPLDDRTIDQLLELGESLLKQINQAALKRDHSFNIPFSKGMKDCMDILSTEFHRVVGPNA